MLRNDMPRRFALILLLLAPPAYAQVNDPRFKDYFLVGQFGEVCTMCEIAVVCQAGESPPAEDAVPASGDFTLYLMHTRTFWSQVSTIWEWFITHFTDAPLVGGHERPVSVYDVSGGNWPAGQERMLRLSLDPGLLSFDDGREIDRVNRRWRRAETGESLGYCSRLALWDTLDVIAARAPKGAGP
ncbi:MAG: hypothetical protein FJ197_00980 [Gammaproteobacteria bacterium]|nr:hypothetical protein [Gammaproteobacteria bacterium]